MKESTKETLVGIFCTKMGWLGICMVLTGVFGVFSSHSTFMKGYEWCWYACLISLAYPVILGLIMTGYGIKNLFTKKGGKDA